MDTKAIRKDFLTALEDDDHPIWSVMLFGGKRPGGDGRNRVRGMVDIWSNHPLDGLHTCETCEQVKREYPYVIAWLERRQRARLRLLAA